jgi:outer membrane protein OmpA-like peptidoglycan-associated protein
VIAERTRAIAKALESTPVLFERGSTQVTSEGERGLAAAVENARMLDALAKIGEHRVALEVRGHADADGPIVSNDPLSLRRA